MTVLKIRRLLQQRVPHSLLIFGDDSVLISTQIRESELLMMKREAQNT